ncbi:MAG: FAD-binding oxidoreductase [Rubrivivax sp.]|nr:FAD-binding oxidoreductase [Rubrivivax sp.]
MNGDSDRFDVVIAGGAVVGSAAAYFLATHAGFAGRVLVLERDTSYRQCATTRSVASIRHQFSTPENIRLSMAGTAFVRQAETLLAVDGQTPGLGFNEAGYLFLATAAGLPALQRQHAVQRVEGADVALLDQPGLAARFDWLRTDDLAGGSLGLSGEGWLDAHALLHGFKRKAQSLGVVYRQAEVAGFECQGSRVVAVRLADGQRIACGWAINAAGTGATALAASAGISLPVVARKRCVFNFRSPARPTGCGLVIDPSGVYFRAEGQGFIAGVAPPEASDPDIVDRNDFEVEHALFDDIVWPTLAHRVPAFEALRLQGSWAGHYDVNLLDANVIVGPHPAVDNLLFANGFSGHGLQQAPGVGRALAEWIVDGGWRSIDLSALGWQRVIDGRPLPEDAVV